ncbi:hypothetical protein [Variovorax sp. WS11]|uniref:hypothetical protein n=1 Tax=Variovorax sp. WS11 TaxID=1105204 RepID=UPI0011B1E2C3|nr:hypothetical protein [Variovorax sp. WS11]NDZ18869.1 hypothetical protein [Variovorax sp. WS11]
MRFDFSPEVTSSEREFHRALEWTQLVARHALLAAQATSWNAGLAQTQGLQTALDGIKTTQKMLNNPAGTKEGVQALQE